MGAAYGAQRRPHEQTNGQGSSGGTGDKGAVLDVVSNQKDGEGLPSGEAGDDGVVVGAGGVGDAGEGVSLESQSVEDELTGHADREEAGGSDEDLGWDAVGEKKVTEGGAAQGEAGLEPGVVGLVGERATEGG